VTTPDWPTCGRDDCLGRRVDDTSYCLAHLARFGPDDFDLFLKNFKPGTDLDVRGTTINDALITKLIQHIRVLGDVNAERATFEGVARIGPIEARTVVLDGARFDQWLEIEVHAERISCVGTRFDKGVRLQVSNAAIDATDATFDSTSAITTSLAFPTSIWDTPKLVSLRGVDVSNLVLADIDLSWCLFAGAHRLDQLRLEGRCRFNRPPAHLRWWSRRQILAEEIFSRRLRDNHPLLPGDPWISQERLAALYRSLRKAFEDSKNEAGAGDFYYGEMEARRHSNATSRAEKLILGTYRLLSGHGQRAARAIAWLGVLVAVVCALLFTVGLPGEVVWTWGRVDQSLRIGMGAVVFREAGQTLTSAGSWTVMVARFAGPVLLALAVLAIRARVKR
jgi:hypothetical protein